jgi:inhibitor of the pro-sigma K processing machinery
LVPALLLVLTLRLIAMPIKWFWKLSVNSACGFVCLWLLNSVSGFTGLYFPVNAVTAVIAGFLGLPGIILLALVQFVL